MPNYVAGTGSLEPKLMAIGEAPGTHENQQQIPFVGPSGEILNDCFRKAGINRREIWLTNVVKYQPPMNKIDMLHLIGISLEDSIKELWENEIERFKPNCILAIGDTALEATTGFSGILNYRGSILLAKDGTTKVVPTIHPAALFNRGDAGGLDYTYLKLIEHDIIRAAEESKTRNLNLPDRRLEIARNSLDVMRFFDEYKHCTKAATDIESINCVPVCVGFAFNRFHALSIPLLTHIGKHRLTDMGYHDLIECWNQLDALFRRIDFIGHNLKYDEFKLNLIGFQLKKVLSDTLIKTRVIFPELPDKKLSTVSSIWTREPFYKDEGKEFRLGKSPIDQLFKYNAKDCAVEFEVDEEQENDLRELQEHYKVPLVDYYYNYMMRKHPFYLKMENNGFAIDFARKRELDKKYTEMAAVVHQRITERIGYEVNVKSYPQVFNLLYKELKLKALKHNPTSEEAIVRLLANHSRKPGVKEILTDLLEERRIRDQKSKAINFIPDYDNRCKTSYNISATETCRSSTGVLKKPVRPTKMGLGFHTIPTHGRLAKDIKSMLIPDKGMMFIKADASQAEARVVAVLAKDYELLEAFDKIDIHRRTAGLIMGYTKELSLKTEAIPVVDIMEKDGPERFCGKKTRHAGNYDMGKSRFMTEFNTDAQKFEINMNISEWRAGQMLDLFHAASPKIKGVFHADIKQALEETRVLIDPFGGVRVFNGRMGDELFKEGYANIPQRTVAHLVQGAALAIDDELKGDKSFMWLGEKHDELIMQVPENNYELYGKLLKKHMMKEIDFSIYCTLKRDYKLVIPCDIAISSTHYGDFNNIKL